MKFTLYEIMSKGKCIPYNTSGIRPAVNSNVQGVANFKKVRLLKTFNLYV